jgi:putative addiction module component (TIGR02574 family)
MNTEGGIFEPQKTEAEIKKLDFKDRAALAKWIVESLDDLSESEVERLWFEEAGRRLQEFREGKVKGIPSEQVFDPAVTDIS